MRWCFVLRHQAKRPTQTRGWNIVGFGEAGIGITSSAAATVSRMSNFPIQDTVGRGTGLEDTELWLKIGGLRRALKHHQTGYQCLDVRQRSVSFFTCGSRWYVRSASVREAAGQAVLKWNGGFTGTCLGAPQHVWQVLFCLRVPGISNQLMEQALLVSKLFYNTPL